MVMVMGDGDYMNLMKNLNFLLQKHQRKAVKSCQVVPSPKTKLALFLVLVCQQGKNLKKPPTRCYKISFSLMGQFSYFRTRSFSSEASPRSRLHPMNEDLLRSQSDDGRASPAIQKIILTRTNASESNLRQNKSRKKHIAIF